MKYKELSKMQKLMWWLFPITVMVGFIIAVGIVLYTVFIETPYLAIKEMRSARKNE